MNIENISVNNLDYSYGKEKVLNGVSLTINRGQITVLSGPNGSGKSTLLSCLHKLSLPEIKKNKDRAKYIAYLEQNENAVWDYKVFDYVLMGRYCHTGFTGLYSSNDRKVTENIMQWVQIDNLAQRSIFELSGGEFQKVRIARCLAQEPSFLLLDEPVANLDMRYQKDLMEILHNLARTKNMGIVVTIHDVNFAVQHADVLALLPKKKNLIKGTVEEVVTKENLQETYGVPMEIYRHPVLNVLQVIL